MKVPSLLAFAAAAGLGMVSAAPVRVIVVEIHKVPSPDAAFSAVRFGHAAAGRLPQDFGVTHPVPLDVSRPRHDCGGGFRGKVNHISNMWRKMLGLETIPEVPYHHIAPRPPHFMNFHGPVDGAPALPPLGNKFHALPISAVSSPYPPGFTEAVPPRHHFHYLRPSNFFQRLGHALSVLGPWEGRALSFVLGCGIGVLLRMIFVFGVLAFRARSCSRRTIALPADEVVFEAEATEHADEKAPIPAETVAPAPASI